MKNPLDIASINVEEVSITGNMPIEEMQSRKIQWKTMDDDDLQSSMIQDPSDDMKAINAMQIRVFSIFIEPLINSEFP